MSEEQQLEKLLYEDEKQFLLECTPIIKKIARRFTRDGFIDSQDLDDLIAHIQEELLSGKLEKMQRQFNGKSLITTYFTRIVYNISVRYGKKKRLYEQRFPIAEEEFYKRVSNANPHHQAILRHSIKRFKFLLKLYGEKSGKVILILKMLLRLPVSGEDLSNAYPLAKPVALDKLLKDYRTVISAEIQTNSEFFEQITPAINNVEQKTNTPDALRKWIDSKLDELADGLNAPPSGSAFDRKSVKLLAEYLFSKLHIET